LQICCRLQTCCRLQICGWAFAVLLGALAAPGTTLFAQAARANDPAAQPVRVNSLDGQLVDPLLMSADTKAVVLLFVSAECPVSNRYAPAVQRLSDAFAAKGVRFWLVYPNPADSVEIIRTHIRDYRYSIAALRDPRHQLVAMAKATITPEAAVFDSHRRLVYHGRIDDRYVNLGLERPAPTRHDLQEALTAVVAGKPVPQATTPAVGCFIADFAQ